MPPDVSTRQALDDDLFLQPTVSWPKRMTVGRRHLVEVDLALVMQDGTPVLEQEWPLDEEECAYTCMLDGSSDFDLWAVHDASVILHRFGGSYGPAEFIVTPRDKPGDRALWLTFVNQWGVPVGAHELRVTVRDAEGSQDPPSGRDVQVGLSLPPAPATDAGSAEDGTGEGLDGPAGGLDWDLSDDEATVDIPYLDLAEPVIAAEVPPAGPAGPPGPDPTVPDLDQDWRSIEDLAATTRLEYDMARPAGRQAPAEQTSATTPRRRDGARPAVRLTESYTVAGLRRSRSGRLHWDLVPLFSAGATRGDRVTFTVRCAPSDEHGTVFAIMAEPRDGSDQAPQLRSVQSAKIPPGIYRVTAELLHPGPGHVRFHGLPAPPREDTRPWAEVTAAVPRRLEIGTGPAHLVAAIEISGPNDIVQERIDSVRRLIGHVSDEARGFVCYSILTYGPHSINTRNAEYPEVPVTTLAWAESADDASDVLARLSRAPAPPTGYAAAAQLECVLADLDRNLTGQEGRPVIVTVGTRPPHPPRVDPATQIVPCRYRNDWRTPRRRLQDRYPDIIFRAIRDAGATDELWRMLGADSITSDEHSLPAFARSLGLTGRKADLIPLPMFASGAASVSPGGPRPAPGDG